MLNLEEDRRTLERLCDRLRSASDARLTRPDDRLPAGSVAGEVHSLAAWAAAAQGVDHPMPRLHPLASADQLAVVGRGLLDWLADDHGESDVLQTWRRQIDQLRTVA